MQYYFPAQHNVERFEESRQESRKRSEVRANCVNLVWKIDAKIKANGNRAVEHDQIIALWKKMDKTGNSLDNLEDIYTKLVSIAKNLGVDTRLLPPNQIPFCNNFHSTRYELPDIMDSLGLSQEALVTNHEKHQGPVSVIDCGIVNDAVNWAMKAVALAKTVREDRTGNEMLDYLASRGLLLIITQTKDGSNPTAIIFIEDKKKHIDPYYCEVMEDGTGGFKIKEIVGKVFNLFSTKLEQDEVEETETLLLGFKRELEMLSWKTVESHDGNWVCFYNPRSELDEDKETLKNKYNSTSKNSG